MIVVFTMQECSCHHMQVFSKSSMSLITPNLQIWLPVGFALKWTKVLFSIGRLLFVNMKWLLISRKTSYFLLTIVILRRVDVYLNGRLVSISSRLEIVYGCCGAHCVLVLCFYIPFLSRISFKVTMSKSLVISGSLLPETVKGNQPGLYC